MPCARKDGRCGRVGVPDGDGEEGIEADAEVDGVERREVTLSILRKSSLAAVPAIWLSFFPSQYRLNSIGHCLLLSLLREILCLWRWATSKTVADTLSARVGQSALSAKEATPRP